MQSAKCKIIGLTGPIASGKSEVAKMLRRRGAYVIDADEVGRSLLIPQSDTWKELIKAFGSKILHPGGKINRKRLGALVFGDPRLLKKLNSIMHPAMKEEIKKELRALSTEHRALVIINAAVLAEMGLIPLVDEVWVVLSSKKKRIARLVKKGLTKERALMRIKAQKPDKFYLNIADKIVRNDGTIHALRRAVGNLVH